MSANSSSSSNVELEIRALLESEDAAWNKGDAEGFAARVTADVIFTNVVGMFAVGKPAFVAQHKHIFSTIYLGSTNRQELVHWKLIRPDVAVVESLSRVTGFQAPPDGIETVDGVLHGRPEQVLVRENGVWWIAAFHNVAVAPPFVPGAAPAGH